MLISQRQSLRRSADYSVLTVPWRDRVISGGNGVLAPDQAIDALGGEFSASLFTELNRTAAMSGSRSQLPSGDKAFLSCELRSAPDAYLTQLNA